MPILSKPSSAARMSIFYITIGALIVVWSGIWYWYLRNHPPANDNPWYYCWGSLLTGTVLLVIGLALGQIGRAARHAELPPEEVTNASILAEQNAAARAPIMAPVNPAAPMVQQGVAPMATPMPMATAPVQQIR